MPENMIHLTDLLWDRLCETKLCFPSFFVAAQVHSYGISYTTTCISFVEWVCFTPSKIIIMTNMFRPWFLNWHSCIYDWRQHDKWYVMVAYCFWWRICIHFSQILCTEFFKYNFILIYTLPFQVCGRQDFFKSFWKKSILCSPRLHLFYSSVQKNMLSFSG